jgi:transcriptional regulator with XRE-family HTH domain
MPKKEVTFGRTISLARKAMKMSQKELASRIFKEEGGAISPQYLNDIEHDRRSPTSDHLIKQFTSVLGEDEDFLFVLAGKIPDDVREMATNKERVVEGFANFRKTISGK